MGFNKNTFGIPRKTNKNETNSIKQKQTNRNFVLRIIKEEKLVKNAKNFFSSLEISGLDQVTAKRRYLTKCEPKVMKIDDEEKIVKDGLSCLYRKLWCPGACEKWSCCETGG